MAKFFRRRSRFLSLPVGSDEDAAGSLRSEIGWTGGEEDEQLLHHGADVGGRHQRQGEVQRAAAATTQNKKSFKMCHLSASLAIL